MGIFGVGLKPGWWWIRSKKDPQWNISGSGRVGMFCRPPEADAAIEHKKKELGREPPDNLEWGYTKD
jgi:hypothetical protein